MRFLVVGDAMVDRYWVGSIDRLNPENHGVPLLKVHECFDRPGGASNVAENLKNMGADVVQVSQWNGQIVKHRIVGDDGTLARFDLEDTYEPIAPLRIEAASVGCCAVLVSDYGKGSVNNRVADAIRNLNLPTFVDVKVRPNRWFSWCVASFPNEREYSQNVHEYRWSNFCVIKRGVKGVDLWTGGNTVHSAPSRARVVKNVTGAGDTVMASFVASYMAMAKRGGVDLGIPLGISMDFAAAAVADPYTAAPTFAEVYGDSVLNLPSHVVPIYQELLR